MKKIYGFLGAVALMVMASCSNETVFEEGPAGTQQTPSVKGDMYMTMAILPSSNAGTRTDTPNQGVEIGQDFENKVSSAQIILAKKENGGSHSEQLQTGDYTIVKSWNVGGDNIAGTSPYTATFEVSRDDILNDINQRGTNKNGSETVKEAEYYVFVIANPTDQMLQSDMFEATKPVQTEFSLPSDADTYWRNGYFLMSNAFVQKITIDTSDSPYTGVALGTHTTEASALNLGTVTIQRAMSRFDLDVEPANNIFTVENAKSSLKDITITFDAVALVNQATVAKLFKVTTESSDALAGMSTSFVPRDQNTATQWVVTPVQDNFSLPFFGTGETSGLTYESNANPKPLYDSGIKVLDGEQVPFANLDFKSYSAITVEDNPFTHPNGDTPENVGSYKIWRYCMENTNQYNPENQLNGNSTGVVFRAIMTSTTLPATYDEDDETKTGKAIYAYGNVFIGDAHALATYFVNAKAEGDENGIYEVARNKYIAAVAAYNAGLGEDSDTPSENNGKLTLQTQEDDPEVKKGYTKVTEADKATLARLDESLVTQDFSIYRPTKVNKDGTDVPVYYCYYVYWNRHNDNKSNTQMGIMEFATVRNNVYKLRVTKINKLGHPGEPDDDPDTPDPDDPDEKDHLYLQVECKILPWEVRINDIEF